MRILSMCCCGLLLCCGAALADTHYVSLSGGHTPPFTNWPTAATNIQDAIDVALVGSTVLVTNGVYDTGGVVVPGALTNRIAITNAITVRSVDGPDSTFIVGNGPLGDSAVRCAYVADGARLVGFTLTNGHTRIGSLPNSQCSGGGFYGGGTASNCTFSGNEASYGGGGMVGAIAYNCVFIGNRAGVGSGGMAGRAAYYCTFDGNSTPGLGGGVFAGPSGGFLAYGCVFINNRAYTGGGMANGNARNCIFAKNAAPMGGGMGTGWAYSCVFVGNAAEDGGGMNSVNGYNCISWNNTATNAGNDFYLSDLVFSCSPDLAEGVDGNITNAPQFVDAAGGDYRLLPSSPCIDAGSNQTWMVGATDLDGFPRIINGVVDMGAFEYIYSPSDYDGDGLSNSDETEMHGTSPILADTDGDAASDYEEYVADTDALDRDAVFRILAAEGRTVWFQSSSNRQYSLLWCHDLMDGRWGVEAAQMRVPGSGGIDSLTDPYNDPGCSYRVLVELP